MCGIAGIIGLKSDQNDLDLMLHSQHHRGPDNQGKWIGEGVLLGHNRLSIIDLSSNANQPFVDISKRYTLVFNGEIYNFIEIREELSDSNQFRTESDTEVLLAAYVKWGSSCVDRFNGMFAFAIFDNDQKTLFAARDRFGVKPFFYYLNNKTFYFASEIKSIQAVIAKKEPNLSVWSNYFTFGSYGMPNETFWKDIKQLPGGHLLEYSNSKLSIRKWYHFEKNLNLLENTKKPFDEVKRHYTELLKDSINLRFRADVEVGFNISGGLDSSTLLAFVNLFKGRDKINAFTFYTGDDNYDELPWVEEMISLTKNPLQKVLLKPLNLEEKINEMTHIQDEPYGGIPTIAYREIFRNARENNILVLLDGQGMDEQWAGYDYYLKNTGATIQGTNKNPFRPEFLSKDLQKLAKKPTYPKPFEDDLLNMQYRDLFYTKIPRALRFNDRVSMAHSTELREPFLDYRLVEYAFAQPIEYKIKNGVQKYLLRDIVSKYLSNNISYAPKRPLQTPQREWLGNELKSYIDNEILKLNNSAYRDWFNYSEVNKEWAKYKNGDNQSSFHIWQLLSFTNLLLTN